MKQIEPPNNSQQTTLATLMQCMIKSYENISKETEKCTKICENILSHLESDSMERKSIHEEIMTEIKKRRKKKKDNPTQIVPSQSNGSSNNSISCTQLSKRRICVGSIDDIPEFIKKRYESMNKS